MDGKRGWRTENWWVNFRGQRWVTSRERQGLVTFLLSGVCWCQSGASFAAVEAAALLAATTVVVAQHPGDPPESSL
jgi:hypothetical protein